MLLEKIKMSVRVATNQCGLFSSNHRKYKVTIKHNGKQYTTDYQCPIQSEVEKKDVIDCLLLDASCFENSADIFDFINELGYDVEDLYKVRKMYHACEKTSKAIHRLFSDEEIELISKEVWDC